jgi:hypothetical protein
MKFAYFVTNSTDGSGSAADDRRREKETNRNKNSILKITCF